MFLPTEETAVCMNSLKIMLKEVKMQTGKTCWWSVHDKSSSSRLFAKTQELASSSSQLSVPILFKLYALSIQIDLAESGISG
jgi:hypothetical protein